MPAQCGLPGKDLANEASALYQILAATDVRTLTEAVSRATTRELRNRWPAALFKTIMGDHLPNQVILEDRDAVVNALQLRAGHWGRS